MDGFQILTLLLPGQAFTYYGEEISMMDTQISWNETIDPMGFENSEDEYEHFSRDFARTPMQWNSNISAGFSTNEQTFLPVNPSFNERNVESQLVDPDSNINIYKKVVSLRKNNPVFSHGGYELESLNENRILVLKRFAIFLLGYLFLFNCPLVDIIGIPFSYFYIIFQILARLPNLCSCYQLRFIRWVCWFNTIVSRVRR